MQQNARVDLFGRLMGTRDLMETNRAHIETRAVDLNASICNTEIKQDAVWNRLFSAF